MTATPVLEEKSVRFASVSVLRRVTFAREITLPVGSATVTLNVANCCPKSSTLHNKNSPKTEATVRQGGIFTSTPPVRSRFCLPGENTGHLTRDGQRLQYYKQTTGYGGAAGSICFSPAKDMEFGEMNSACSHRPQSRN